jgi:hypothetical protein
MCGSAEVGHTTRARVTWTLAPEGEGTRVRLAAEVIEAGWLDRVLLALGGAAWMRAHFGAVISRLDGATASGASAPPVAAEQARRVA